MVELGYGHGVIESYIIDTSLMDVSINEKSILLRMTRDERRPSSGMIGSAWRWNDVSKFIHEVGFGAIQQVVTHGSIEWDQGRVDK